jgi:muramoyltetrapeptide carboxypeptidase
LTKKTLRIIKAASLDREGLLRSRLEEIRAQGIDIQFTDIPPDPSWPYCAGTIADRSKALNDALLDDSCDGVWWARGGYGTSELLALVPWSSVKQAKPKPIIGFSDACAAQSALYVMTARQSIHGAMPATSTWNQNTKDDINQLLGFIKGESTSGEFEVSGSTSCLEGTVFGGNLAVLSSLIGTPYLPKSFRNHILLFEDIAENPGRVIRMLNQWKQSGLFAGVAAIILGSFTGLGGDLPDNSTVLIHEARKRFDIPIFNTTCFGHVSPNFHFVIGSQGKITNGKFRWQVQQSII